ncbi:F0F1 ATP synthase subunit A [Acidimicrobiaceae bacterium USS-CC1]|uniref:ATP synthase subunit a n=1 Tax=Acidiferrimicrobium australe TaxID=2664430 RepID=A0ABW9QYB9_9ACTN|nr:F0F1 ATP synthase subunit A [Acidiferrimicrobium australe]
MGSHLLGAINVPIGEHLTAGPLNIDTMYTTTIAVIVVIGLGLWARSKMTSGEPGKVQLVWESVAGFIGDQAEGALGPNAREVVPWGITIFMLVLVADWIEILPGIFHGKDYLPSPSADVNFCYALGITVWLVTNFAGIRARAKRTGSWGKGYVQWLKMFFEPLHFVEHITRWLTLALRLFGNIFAGSIMIALLLAFPVYFFPATIGFTVVWKLFDMFIGVVQAFIFALLTILYWQFNVETH